MDDREHPLLALSEAALRFGAALRRLPAPDLAPPDLARRLYAFNTQPVSRAWRDRLPDAAAVLAWLGPGARSLEADYAHQADEGRWLHWRRPGAAGALRHKLYVSPRAGDLPATFARAAEVCRALAAPAFKVGANAAGVLRPDKFVLYFDSAEHRHAVGQALTEVLRGTAAQGVPFTAPVDALGVVSSGFDPGGPIGSWRQLVVSGVVEGLVRAQGDVVLADVRRTLAGAGVDPRTWTPLEVFVP